jgi:hypothetical protein
MVRLKINALLNIMYLYCTSNVFLVFSNYPAGRGVSGPELN